jgi:hypothetical protein
LIPLKTCGSTGEFSALHAILDRFVQKVAQIIQTEGAACFSLGVADNRLHPQAVISGVMASPAIRSGISTSIQRQYLRQRRQPRLTRRGPVVLSEATRLDEFGQTAGAGDADHLGA